jgi:hypothetical protein
MVRWAFWLLAASVAVFTWWDWRPMALLIGRPHSNQVSAKLWASIWTNLSKGNKGADGDLAIGYYHVGDWQLSTFSLLFCGLPVIEVIKVFIFSSPCLVFYNLVPKRKIVLSKRRGNSENL